MSTAQTLLLLSAIYLAPSISLGMRQFLSTASLAGAIWLVAVDIVEKYA
jgi:hypothetical protein